MIAIIYNKETKEINSMVVPDKGETLNKENIRLFNYQDILVIDKEIDGVPNIYKFQELLNNILWQKSI